MYDSISGAVEKYKLDLFRIDGGLKEPAESETEDGIEGIRTIKSVSREEVSQITVEFIPERNIDAAANDVRDRVARVRGLLPDEVDEPVVSKIEADAQAILWLAFTSDRHDALFLPADDTFALSASYDMAGFAVSYAFETSNERTLERARVAFEDLSDDLWNQFGGCVHLVKNVCARRETLWAMYGKHADEFFDLKRELDPDRVLDNEFLERNFGAPPGTTEPAAV